MFKSRLVFLVLLASSQILVARTVAILVHGTWAVSESWCQPGGDFYQVLEKQLAIKQIPLLSFAWSGKLSYAERTRASQSLVALIKSYPEGTKFILISHSHGGNVSMAASQILCDCGQILTLYNLGTPIDSENYQPNMQTVQYCFNIFSFGDLYQPILGFYQRVLPKHDRVYNISLEVDGANPNHEDLHSVVIAKNLLELGSWAVGFSSEQILAARIYGQQLKSICVDLEIKTKLERDQRLQAAICWQLASPEYGRYT